MESLRNSQKFRAYIVDCGTRGQHSRKFRAGLKKTFVWCTYPGYNNCGSSAHLFVRVLVRWAKGKRLTNCLPNLSLMTLSPPGTDRILRVDAPPHTRGSNFWGSRSDFQIPDMIRKLPFLKKKRFHGGREIRTHDQRLMFCRRRHLWRSYSLIIRWAKGKRLTNRLPNLSLTTQCYRSSGYKEVWMDVSYVHNYYGGP